MLKTFVGLTMDVSVVSLMPVASVGLTGHETEPGVGAVLAEELMMIRSVAEAVMMTSLLTRLKMKMRKTKIKTLPRMKLLLPLWHQQHQLKHPRRRKGQLRRQGRQRRKRPRKLVRQRRKLLVLLAQSLRRTLLLPPQLRLLLQLRLPKCLVCVSGELVHTFV
jgi:hypothetical protein